MTVIPFVPRNGPLHRMSILSAMLRLAGAHPSGVSVWSLNSQVRALLAIDEEACGFDLMAAGSFAVRHDLLLCNTFDRARGEISWGKDTVVRPGPALRLFLAGEYLVPAEEPA